MSASDYYRPSEEQINIIYTCGSCQSEIEQCSIYDVGNCHCGGTYNRTGESYPADSNEWNEQKDPDGEWRDRRY